MRVIQIQVSALIDFYKAVFARNTFSNNKKYTVGAELFANPKICLLRYVHNATGFFQKVKPIMSQEDAITLLQRHERARQGRLRAKVQLH